jgi:thioredoxin reductase (NADPH)
MVQKYMLQLPSSRVQINGPKFDDNCRNIRAFLSTNRVPYHRVDTDRLLQSKTASLSQEKASSSIVVDDEIRVSHPPTVRKVAESLGFQTIPKRSVYDIVIIGGGPAGLAAADGGVVGWGGPGDECTQVPDCP